ncbi:zinc-finger of mitochondrial splicing suppressor 51-domain-containing protein [Mycotypha africana]|uniref:zinc-finger of mitochondrial splicing suppressor 51-domain-containing protein n=1 Tax=Mycotypha africana TaxID=64632 RepID=UPI0023007DBE|nr:zinc-finger of mitochondrial splicing suppressor 51-domain-containing protein [Mycotypha africana]KAI8969092.1 zinc-finger of mitochondrial splicing suppressor 51-domain-containing protein [Mycotypha africana]
MKEHAQENPVLYDQDHLFHILSQSPIPELRDRANIVKKYGVCPVCEALGENTEHKPAYDCPDCGYPTHCSEKHYYMGLAEHKEHHCDILRQINEDDHDLRSGRPMREFEFPSTQGFDETVNMANWDMFFYTRSFPSMDSDRSMRHVSKLLTYPMSIGQLLHESCPYKYGEQITKEGMRSIAALRTILYPGDRLTNGASPAFNTETINIYILGARAEATLPSHIWLQLSYLFPATPFHLHFVGPDALAPKQKPHTESVHERLIFTYNNAMYHDYHETIEKFDPFTDLFFLFSPGIGYPDARPSWKPSIAKALETKCPIFITGFSEADIMNDIKAVEQDHANEFDWLLKPTVNEFRSLKRDVNLMDLRQTAFANHSIWGIRGKRYDVVHDPAHSD